MSDAVNSRTVRAQADVTRFPGPSEVEGSRPVPGRRTTPGSGRTLAVVPAARLDADVAYRLDATTLADVEGGVILVPSVTFTTKADVPPTDDTRQLVFGMPDATGFVSFDGPVGTLPPGSQILVVDTGTGEVASFTADNDGAVSGTLVASIRRTAARSNVRCAGISGKRDAEGMGMLPDEDRSSVAVTGTS